MDSESNTSNKNTNKEEDCVLVEDDDALDESNLNTTIGNETSKLAAKTPVSQKKKANKNGDLNSSVTNSCEKISKNQMKLENAKKRQEEKEKKEREKKEKEELRAKQEEERKRKKEEEEKQRLKRLEEKEKQEEERKRKKEEEEKQRLKRLEEKEKEKQERLEKERKRQEQINLRNEEKRKKEEEKKRAEEEKKRLEEEKQREEEEKKRKAEKVKSHFASYFIKKDMPSNLTDREELKSLRFMPFQLKANMYLAPICRNIEFANMNQEQREEFTANIDSFVLGDSNHTYESNYLKQLRENGKLIRRSYKSIRKGYNKMAKSEIKTDETSNDEIKLIENLVPMNNMTRYKVKYLHFDPKQYRRPPYYGTWKKKSNKIRGRNPFGKDEKIIDYEVDSDDEWEDEADGESIADSDKGDMEEDTLNGDDEDDDGFFVPHGHLSDDELDEEERNLDEETKKAKEEAKKEQYETERNKKSKYLVPKCFFLNEYWNVPDKLDLDSVRSELKILNKYQMVPLMTPLPFIISNEVPNQDKKSDETTGKSSKNANSDNISSPNPTPKSKSSKQAKQNLNNSSTQSPSTASAAANNKGSIIKFISKLSNKTGKIEAVGTNSTSSETTTTQNVTSTTETISSNTTDSINTKNTPTIKLKKGNSSVVLRQGSPSTPLNTKNPTNTSTTAEKRTCNENSESAVKRLKLDDGQSNETKSATKTTASPTILTLFKNSSCRKNLRLSACEIDMREEDTIMKPKEQEDKISLLSPKKGSIKANSIDENSMKLVKTDVLMDTSESVDNKNENTNNKENSVMITID